MAYQQLGFNPFKALERAFTFTPKSFTPANIVRTAVKTATFTTTGGLLPILAPKIDQQIANVAASNVPLLAASTALAVGAPKVAAAIGVATKESPTQAPAPTRSPERSAASLLPGVPDEWLYLGAGALTLMAVILLSSRTPRTPQTQR